MLIRNLIKNDFDTVSPYQGTYTVKKSISKNRAIVVMEEGVYMGVLTADDLVARPHNLVIDCISTKPGLAPNNSILEAINIMKQYNVTVLPVYDRGTFLGLIYYGDILECLSRIIEDQKIIVQSVAHDLKNPIANIYSLATLLKENLVKDEDLELVAYTMEACGYATGIINDLLHIPQLEGDQDENGNYELADLNAFLKECVEGIHVFSRTKEIKIIDDISPEAFYFPIAKTKFKRAVHNLLSNAIKFTPEKGMVCISSLQQGDSIMIKIQDNGIGIPASTQPFIFQKFTKAKRSGTVGEQSFGLGLFITKQIIELHNGRLWFESLEKAGTTFYITFGSEYGLTES
jgi:signal transduction histidine kinase